MTPKLKILAFLTPALIVLDQLTKLWVVRTLRYSGRRLEPHTLDALKWLGSDSANKDEIQVIPGFLSFIHAQNPGAAMGIGIDFDHRMWLFGAFTIVAVVVLGSMYRQLADNDRFQTVTISLILAGAVGNAIDRVHKQTVTDWIRMYTDYPPLKAWLLQTRWHTNEWPTYNIADSCIVVGVILYLLYYLVFAKDQDTRAQGRSPMQNELDGPADATP
jgi:signal peptidase II